MKELTISVASIQEGMVLSKDIINDEGIFLISKDTIINHNHIIKLQLYQIDTISVFDMPIVTETAIPTDTIFVDKSEPLITQTKEFKAFFSNYVTSVNALEREFSSMVKTGNVKNDELYSIVNSIVPKENTTSKVFSFLCRVQTLDNATFSHCMNVSILSAILGKWLHLSDFDIMNLSIAGLLHDIGMTQIDSKILNKREPLTQEEFAKIKTHPTLGYKMISNASIDDGIKQAVLMHHEKMNGSGYPLNLNWDLIHKYAKIISIVDIYDAITSERPYHRRYHPFTAIKILEEECYGVLDTDYLYVFLENIAQNFIGNDVLLSTGDEAKIVFINSKSPSHPMVQTKSNKFIDLLTYDFITINQFL